MRILGEIQQMTREMNKPKWCKNTDLCGWWQTRYVDECKKCFFYECQPRILNPDIAEFFWNCCKMERLEK